MTSNTAKFSVAEKNLSLKASMAVFSIMQGAFVKALKPSAVMHSFYSLVTLIAIYGSEVWSAYKPCFQNKYRGPQGFGGSGENGFFLVMEMGSTGDYFGGSGEQAYSFGVLGALPKS